MFVDHNTYDIPCQIAGLSIRPLSWNDFQGEPPQDSPYVAHIYWSVNYEFGNTPEGCKPDLKVSVKVRPKSWRVKEELNLLKHEYGHYLIGCLCGLAFIKRSNYDQIKDVKSSYGQWYKKVLSQCLKEYCAIQRQYDDQTNHNLNRQMQSEWQRKLSEQFWQFYRFFQVKKRENKRSRQQSRAKLREQKLNKSISVKTDDTKNALRNKNRNFSIKRNIYRKQSQELQEKEINTLPILCKNGNITVCDKKVLLGPQIRCFRKMETDQPLNKIDITIAKEIYYFKPHISQRVIR